MPILKTGWIGTTAAGCLSWPAHLLDDDMPGNVDGGSVFYGEKGILVTDIVVTQGCAGLNDGTKAEAPAKTLLRIKNNTSGHIANFTTVFWTAWRRHRHFLSRVHWLVLLLMSRRSALFTKTIEAGETATDWAPYNYPDQLTELGREARKLQIINPPTLGSVGTARVKINKHNSYEYEANGSLSQ